jgi:asparagine synthase (glutamine-hydrolysing)
MCGIAGIVSLNSPLRNNLIAQMCQRMGHRGPDDEGFLGVDLKNKALYTLYSKNSQVKHGCDVSGFEHQSIDMFLGHKRLSIIDLSPSGHQPMSYKKGKLWIIFNGEIYNYKELREELKARGLTFQSSSDTETILAAYEAWSEGCVNHFIGDWAFVIYDTENNTLFLSRDRFGIKPLYYFYSPESKFFAFASEIKSLLGLPHVESAINRENCFEFLVFAIQEHGRETFYKDIYQIEPSFNLTVSLDTLSIAYKQYYTVFYPSFVGQYNHTKALQYADDIMDLLIDSVRLRLRADVPIGTSLSGGLDSSSVVVIINKILKESGVAFDQIGERQKTFTISYPGEAVDESRFARLIVDITGADGHFISPSLQQLHREIYSLLWFQDEPVGGASQYVQWKMMEEASRYIKVILDGQGGDEIFGGYSVYSSAYFAQLIKKFNFGKLMRELRGSLKMKGSFKGVLSELKTLPMHLLPDVLKPIFYLTIKRRVMKETLKELEVDLKGISSHFLCSFTDNLNEILHLYLMKYCLPHLLHYEDRNSMAFSIESRTPFTDHRLVDYVFSIPACYKYRDGWSKWLLRLAMRGLLPEEILWRRDKIGFAPSQTMHEYDRHRIFSIWYQQAGEANLSRPDKFNML